MTTKVAPITGAWIETKSAPNNAYLRVVAPITGAWIETSLSYGMVKVVCVAPITGAWIETVLQLFAKMKDESHPSRVRGLKHKQAVDAIY